VTVRTWVSPIAAIVACLGATLTLAACGGASGGSASAVPLARTVPVSPASLVTSRSSSSGSSASAARARPGSKGSSPASASPSSSSSSSTSAPASRTGEPAVRPLSEKKRIEREQEATSKKGKRREEVTSGRGASNSTGELPAPYQGEFALLSPAFGRNGPIPAEYTCDGKDVSPPLEWQNVPKGAAALVLIVIDDSGIRWFVGDIDPSAKGVAAGLLPAGGIAGSDTQGKGGYGGICPPAGKSDTVQFTLYALSKKIPLSRGFEPALAESEYGAGHDVIGQPAVTYATYTRP